MAKWLFEDPPNSASFVTGDVFRGSPILRVYHDFEGGWQFHGEADESSQLDEAQVVCLSTMVEQDQTTRTLHDLPYGWMAFRSDPTQPWERSKNHPFPTHEDDGYYLEDAEWLAQFLLDIKPPCEDALSELEPGDTVKLVFRFREESAPRGNKQCERMWVQIINSDEDEGIFTGRLDNDPHHQGAIQAGDELCFLPSHVIEIYSEGDD